MLMVYGGGGMAVRLTRAERREQTRQELVTAAEECFVSGEFHASSVEQVADRAGYTKARCTPTSPQRRACSSRSMSGGSSRPLTEVLPDLRRAGAEQAVDWMATATVERRGRDALAGGLL